MTVKVSVRVRVSVGVEERMRDVGLKVGETGVALCVEVGEAVDVEVAGGGAIITAIPPRQ